MILTALTLSLAAWLTPPPATSTWTRFRGPNGSGRIEGPAPPTEWSSDANLRWRTALPGSGTSSPIVSGDRVYVTAYTGYGVDPENVGELDDLARHLIALDRKSGKELWRATVPGGSEEDPYAGFICQHGYASSTPVTDGERIYALFGKAGLFAFELDGEEIWRTSVGAFSDPAKWGSATSPILVGETIVVDAGVLGHQLVGVDAATGDIKWSIEDASYTNSWSTPTTVPSADGELVLFSVPRNVIAVDPATGEVAWKVESPMDDSTTASVITRDQEAYLMGTRAGRGLAIDCEGGEDGEPDVIWKKSIRSGISTPVIVGNGMFWCSSGIFMGASLDDGEYFFRERVPRYDGASGGFGSADYSSPVAVGDLIFQFARNGEGYVLRASEEFELVAHNPAFEGDESNFSSSPALADGDMFIRSERFLYCIGESVD
ncbi:MAG: PQQ-binding-like beta-propeller repeat protein [Planctomycetota bacterium]